MNKTELQQQIGKLEAEVARLRTLVDGPATAPSLLTKPVPVSGDVYYAIGFTPTNQFAVYQQCASVAALNDHGNLFQTRKLAQAYAEAIDTMLLLRHQPGSEPPGSREKQWGISIDDDPLRVVVNMLTMMPIFKLVRISPMFATKEHAEAAIEAVGAERILRMLKTFHHVE